MRHNKSLPCVVCKQIGHDFDGCPALNNHDFLRSAVIKSSLYWANQGKLQAKMAKAVLENKQQQLIHKQNKLTAALHSIDSAYDSESSYEPEYEDDDPDFH